MRAQDIQRMQKAKNSNYRKGAQKRKKQFKEQQKDKYSETLSIIKSLPSIHQQHLIISQTPYISSVTLPPYIHNGEYNSFYHKLYDFLTLIILDYYTDQFRPKTKRLYKHFIDYTQETLSKVKQFLFYSSITDTIKATQKMPQFHKERNKSINKMVTVQSDDKAEKKYTRNRTDKSPDFYINKDSESLEKVKEIEQDKIKSKFYNNKGKDITTEVK